MRVAFVAADALDGDGEQATRVRRVAESLAARGHDVEVLCRQFWDGTAASFEVGGLRYRAVISGPGRHGFGLRLPPVLAAAGPDVVHAVDEPPAHVLAARTGCLLAGAPLLVDWYDPPPGTVDTQGSPGRARRLAARSGATFVTPSRLVRTAVRELGAPGDAVRVVPNGVDWELVTGTEPADCGEIVYSRRLDADANLETLLLALAEFREYDWRATVVGDGPGRAGYERQAGDLRIDDRVSFVGETPLEERVALFRDAHVYVQTARRCSFPTDLLWALAAGCVGVVEYHAASSAHELLETRDRGLLATGDTELVEAITAAGDLPRMDENEEFAEFDHDRVLERYLDCYREAEAARGLR